MIGIKLNKNSSECCCCSVQNLITLNETRSNNAKRIIAPKQVRFEQKEKSQKKATGACSKHNGGLAVKNKERCSKWANTIGSTAANSDWSIPPLEVKGLGHESQHVSILLNGLGQRLAGAMTSLGLNADEQRCFLEGLVANTVVQLSSVLV